MKYDRVVLLFQAVRVQIPNAMSSEANKLAFEAHLALALSNFDV